MRFRTNLQHIIFRALQETAVALVAPPPVNAYYGPQDLDLSERQYDFEVTMLYAEAVKDVGKEKSVAVVDVREALWTGVGKEER